MEAIERILHVSRPTIYAMIERGKTPLIKLGPRTNRIDLKEIKDTRNSFPLVSTGIKEYEAERKRYMSLDEAAEKFKKDRKTIKARASEAGVPLAYFDGKAHFGWKGLERLFLGEREKHDYLTVEQLAQECGISKQPVYDYIHDQRADRANTKAFLLSAADRKAIIALHVEGIVNYVDGFNAKKWDFND